MGLADENAHDGLEQSLFPIQLSIRSIIQSMAYVVGDLVVHK